MEQQKRTASRSKAKQQNSTNSQDGYVDNEFIALNDLVYAPLYALALSNMQLRSAVIESIKSMGTVKQNGQEEIIHMNHLNMAYQQIKPNAEEGYNVENLQVEVPLMSIIPVTNMNVEKAEIEFSTEVRVAGEGNAKGSINARICSPSQRDSDFLPKVSYKMQVNSIPATEGMLRLTDVLSTSQVAKQLDTTPVSAAGNLNSEEEKAVWQQKNEIQNKIKQLNLLYQRIADTMEEQERLRQISNEWDDTDTYSFDKKKYSHILSDLTNRMMELKEAEMNQAIEMNRQVIEEKKSEPK